MYRPMRVAGDSPKVGEDCERLVAGSSRVGFTDAEVRKRGVGIAQGDEHTTQDGDG